MIRNFTLFLLLCCTLTLTAQTAGDCTVATATPIINGLDLIASDQPYTNGVNQTYCFNTEVPLNLENGIGTVKLTSDLPGGYPFSLFVTNLETNTIDTLSEFGDSIQITNGQLYFVEVMPTGIGTGELALIPVPILVLLGAAPDTVTIEIIAPVCPTPNESFTCGSQNYSQVQSDLSVFEFSTDDDAYPAGGDWRINGLSYETNSSASLEAEDVLRFEIPQDGTYEICYETLDEDGCSNYCCRTYCLDTALTSDLIDFTLSPNGTGYNIAFDLPGATDISYYGGVPFAEATETSISIPFPTGDCYFTNYTFRYREGDCWKTARIQVYICDPYDCNDITFDFDRENESWDLSLTPANADSVIWLDDDNAGATLASDTTAVSIDPRSEEQCGLRKIYARYFDGANWRYCGLRFWDCNPYDCTSFTPQVDEAEEALDLTFTGANATQITWKDDATGQNLEDSDGETMITLAWPAEIGCQTRFISVRYFDSELDIFRFCAIEAEVCRPDPCEEPMLSFSCGNQQFFQSGINGGSDFTFSTTDPTHPDSSNWRVNGDDVGEIDYASLLPNGDLTCDFPDEGSYEICYVTVDDEGCENYCCRNYCIDFTPPVEPTTFEIADDGQGYELTFSLAGASEVSWYVPGQSDLTGNGVNVDIPFPQEGCFYRTYYFRYFEGDCWKTAIRRVFACDPFNCNNIVVAFDRQDEFWDLSFTAANANSITWIDDDNGGATLANETTAISLNPRPEGQCGVRNISVRYFNGLGWRYCSFRFWDCNPYECTSFTSQTDEAGEALNLTFSGANASQITWSDDVTGQNIRNSNGQTSIALAWPVTGCETRFISVRYFDSVLDIFRTCAIEVEVCRPEQCSDNDIVDNCNDFSYFRSGVDSYSFTSSGEVAENEDWLINRVRTSEVGFPANITSSTLNCVFPDAGTYEICYPFLDEGGCVDYCCEEYCIDLASNEALITFNYEANTELYRLQLNVGGAQQVSWYYLNDSGDVQESSSENIAYVSIPAAGNCFTRTYYFSYLDASGCPRVAFRQVRICNPLDCDNINFRFDRTNNEYDLTFTGSALAGSLQWLDDDAGGVPLSSSTEQQSIPLLPGVCGPRNVSIRYFDGSSWNICALRYWACDPYECNDLTATDDANNEEYVFSFTGSNSATEISWQDDISVNEIAGSSGQRQVILPYPTQECVTRFLSIRYFDPGFGGYRTCAVEQEICRPEPCDSPAFIEGCSNQNYFQLENGNYRFTTSSTVAPGESWLVNGIPQGQGGNDLTLSFPVAGSYLVCYPYIDGNGCLNYCCRTYCIDPEPESSVAYDYLNDGNILRLELTGQGATSVDWYLYNNGLRTSLGNGRIITRAVLPTCGYVTYYVRYFSDGCWKVNTRTIWVCNPFRCGGISFDYNQASDGFDLELAAEAVASNITWQDDDTGTALNGNGRMLLLPVDGDCRYRNISVRYFDGTGWRVCGLRLYVCDPFDCGDISYVFAPDGDVIEFDLNGADNATEISWTDDNSGQTLPGSSTNTTLVWDGDCRVRNISVQYRDPVSEGFRICNFRFFACAPRECESFISFEEGEDNEVLISTEDGFEQLSWSVDGAAAGAGNVLRTVIPPGESRTICVRYFDPANGYFRTCCRTITAPDCEPPVPAFRIERNLDTITVVNESPDADATYLWDFGGLSQSTLSQPPSLHLPPGRQLVCLRVTNACGSEEICLEIVVPDLANNLVLELGDSLCAAPGEIVSVPLRVRNFTDITSYQFSLSLSTPRYGKFRELRFLDEEGVGSFSIVNDSMLTVTWVRTDAQTGTIPDGTLIGVVDMELTGNEAGTGVIAFSNSPTAQNFEYTDGQSGLPITVDGTYELCPSTGSISGRIRREDGAGVGQVIVSLERNGLNIQSLTTDASGDYLFTGLRPGRTYKVVSTKDIGYRNGVTAGDLSRIQQHLEQRPELATPYKRIAADVAGIGQITTDDVSDIRQLIFRELTTFEDVNSWEFVPLAYDFPNPDAPHNPTYPNVLDFTATSVELSGQDFVGMKMGDIGDSANPENLSNTGPNPEVGVSSDLTFELSSEAPMRDQAYEVDVLANNFTNLLAGQFSLGWTTDKLRFDSLSNLNEALALNDLNFSTVNTTDGRLAWLWFAAVPVSLAESSSLFTVHFTVLGEVAEELEVSFTEDPTEFSFEDTDTVLIANFTDLQRTIEFPASNRPPVAVNEWRVFPNPATKWINVAAINGSFGPEQLELFDTQGRSVRKWTSTAEGNYSIAGLPSGVYQLWLSSAVGVQVARLVVVD